MKAKPPLTVVSFACFVILLITMALLLPHRAQGQLIEVRQTVFGMDCAPCAYALEKRLKGLDGVTDARVSLNEGLAAIKMKPQNDASLRTIVEAVRSSGFSPRESVISADGMLVRNAGGWTFELPAGDRLDVRQPPTSDIRLDALEPGRVRIEGQVRKRDFGHERTYELELSTIQSI